MRMNSSSRRLRSWFARGMKYAPGCRSEKGTALVEFAITLPLFLALLIGTASFSLGLYYMQQIGNATAKAVNYVASDAGIATTYDPCATAVTQVTAALPHLTATNFTYTLYISNPATSGSNPVTTTQYGPTGSTFTCSGAPMTPNYAITLTVSYAYTWFPILKFKLTSPLSSTQGAIQE